MGKYEPLDAITGHDGDNGLNAKCIAKLASIWQAVKSLQNFLTRRQEECVHYSNHMNFFCLSLLHDHDSTKTQAKIQLNRSIIKHFLLYSDTLNGKILPNTLDSRGNHVLH